MNDNETLVIGGGVIGVCAAYFLARRGLPVTLLEQGQLASGSSYGNAGLIVPGHSVPLAHTGALASGLKWLLDPQSPFYIKPRPDPALLSWLLRFSLASRQGPMLRAIPVLRDLGMASLQLFEQLAGQFGPQFDYQRQGVLVAYESRSAWQAGAQEAHLLAGYGIETQVLDGPSLAGLEPLLRPDLAGGVFFPHDTHLDPAAFVRAMAGQAEAMGARILTDTEALQLETDGRRVSAVHTTRGVFHPGQVVLAAGAWSPGMARSLRLKLPVQAAKGYSMTFQRPDVCPSLPLLLGESRVAVTPLDGTLRLGGTLELSGLDGSINLQRVAAIQRAARAFLPGLPEMELLEIWRGWRPCTPDGLPVIGRSPAHPNLVIATGHAMLGMTYGPVTGQLVSELVAGVTPSMDLTPLRVERFS